MKRTKATKPPRKRKSARSKAKPALGKKSRAKSRTAAHAGKNDAIAAYVGAAARALGLTIDPAWQPAVEFNLRLVLRHAALLDEFRLPEDLEPAPVFHA